MAVNGTIVVHNECLQLPQHSDTAQGRSLATLQILQALVEPGSHLADVTLQAMTQYLDALTHEFGAESPVELVIQELVQREQIYVLQGRVPGGSLREGLA